MKLEKLSSKEIVDMLPIIDITPINTQQEENNGSKSLLEATREELIPIVYEIMNWSINPLEDSPNIKRALDEYTDLKGLYEDEAARIIVNHFIKLSNRQ